MDWSSEPSLATIDRQKIAYHRVFPKKMNWNAVKTVYDLQPSSFEEMILLRGIGANTFVDWPYSAKWSMALRLAGRILFV
jgi:hypothetical protein